MSDDTNGTDGTDGTDARLLDALRRTIEQHDPVPAAVERMARESFAWRTVDAELAELAYDSVFDDALLAGVRSGEAPRALTFEGATFAVEIEVEERGDHRRLVGQVVPPSGAEIEVRHAGGPSSLEADTMGRFATEVETGLVSLRCQLHGGDRAVLETAWVIV
ncbi:MAG: hypothetical protein ACRD0N_03990 [Acidimicrobiales bacterium]